MDSAPSGLPIWDSLAELATSTHIEAELINLLRRLGGRGAVAPTTAELEGEGYEEASESEEDGNISGTSQSCLLGCSCWTICVCSLGRGWGVDGVHIHSVYASLYAVYELNEEELLREVAWLEAGVDLGLVLCIKD